MIRIWVDEGAGNVECTRAVSMPGMSPSWTVVSSEATCWLSLVSR